MSSVEQPHIRELTVNSMLRRRELVRVDCAHAQCQKRSNQMMLMQFA